MNYTQAPFQTVTNLGNMLSLHGYSPRFRNNRFIFSGLILAGIFGCLCLFLFALMDGSSRPTAPGAGSSNLIFTTGAVIFIALLGLFLIFRMLREWLYDRRYYAALFDGGVAVLDHVRRIHTAAWRDMQSVQAVRLKRGGFRTYTVICEDGRMLSLPHYLEGVQELAGLITNQISG